MNNARGGASPAPTSPSLPAFVWWAATIAWTITIFEFSTATYGISLTGWMLNEILRLLHVQLQPATFQMVHHLMRKMAHLTEYAIYALLLYGSLGGGKDFRWNRHRASICALIAAGYSLTDEFHQLFVPGRGASILDSALDASGALLAMAGLYVFTRFSRTRTINSAASTANPAET